jgi:LPS O-antigen subunit length determinant protein (WzzB/FepE family)
MSDNQPTVRQDEFDLLELIRGLRRQWLWLVICPVVLFIAALVILHFVKPQYEASLLLQIGQAGQIEPQTDRLIESPTAVASRVTQFAYLPKDMKDSSSADALLFKKDLTAVALGGTNFVLIRSRGYDRSVLNAEMSALSDNIIRQHGVVLGHLADVNRAYRASLQQDVNRATSFATRIGETAVKNDPKSSDGNVLTSLLLADTAKDLREIKDQMHKVDAALDPTRTYNTFVITLESEPSPVSPRRAQILAVAIIFGLLIGGIIALGREYVRRHP